MGCKLQVAILGDSSSGKSTILRLIHRLYDPTHGTVFFDGRHMDSLNIGWLRSQIGHVPQKPVLFNKTVEENVRFAKWSATQAEIEDACKKAGIHEDILCLPQGYKTVAGLHGKKLSASQRRKIAFARAYLQRPKVLLMDDPISQCDKEYEESLLSTINQLRQNTTVVITATEVNSIVRQCDRIYVLDRGQILEQGNHVTLIQSGGLYAMIENGMREGVPADLKHREFSQLNSYNFAKASKKWRRDRLLANKRSSVLRIRKSAILDDNLDDEDGTSVKGTTYERKTRELIWIAGGYNPYTYARKDFHPYNLREGNKGVNKANNVEGLALLKSLTMKKPKSLERVPFHHNDEEDDSVASLTPAISHFNLFTPSLNHFETGRNDTLTEPDLASIQSEHDGEFWDEYETVLDSLEDDVGEVSWKYIFTIGIGTKWIFLIAGFISAVLGIYGTIFHLYCGNIYQEVTRSRILRLETASPVIVSLIVAGVVVGILSFLQCVTFMIGGFKLTSKLKQTLFSKMLLHDLEWFDKPENDISILCHRLSIDTAAIENTLMIIVGVICQGFLQFVSAVIVSLLPSLIGDSPKLAIFCALVIPLSIIFIGLLFVDGRYQLHWNKILDNILTPVTEVEMDVVANIRTVITLGLEEHFLAQITEELAKVKRKIYWLNVYRSFLWGVTRAFSYFIYLVMAVMSLRLIKNGYNTVELILLGEILIQNQITAGIGLAMFPHTESVRAAAFRLYNIMTTESHLGYSDNPKKIAFTNPPSVTVRNLRYNHPETNISINNISFHVESNGFLGVVGIGTESGTSLLFNILARFYKPAEGSILLDETDIWELDVHAFRKATAFLEESPTINSLTIRENIIYGLGSKHITIEEIVKAAMDVRIHDIIIRLPQGYETKVGSIENDQRMYGLLQRLTLARAVVRNPKAIFIHENIMPLNEEDDALFQEAVITCSENRTKILVTERVSSVEFADLIIVLQNGKVLEEGTHLELIENKKLYYQMFLSQKSMKTCEGRSRESSTYEIMKNKRRSTIASNAYERYVQRRIFTHTARYINQSVQNIESDKSLHKSS